MKITVLRNIFLKKVNIKYRIINLRKINIFPKLKSEFWFIFRDYLQLVCKYVSMLVYKTHLDLYITYVTKNNFSIRTFFWNFT